jgi:hypothetical protein
VRATTKTGCPAYRAAELKRCSAARGHHTQITD